MGKERYLVTSALPYANGPIHLGHLAGAYLPADIFVRYQRLKSRDILFICGTDEHGVPITITAEKEGVSPKDIVDKYYQIQKESFEKIGISFDNFSRTSYKLHHETSQDFFLNLYKKNYLTEKVIRQFYCTHCKRFLSDRYVEGICPHCKKPGARGDQCESCGKWLEQTKLIEPKCKICGNTPEIRKTKHWFLKFGEFQEKLKKWIDSKKDWKENVINFCNGWFKEGLQERAVTRDLEWGVPVPLDNADGKVLYVWFDAPLGYISSTKELSQKLGKPDLWKKYWLDKNTKLIHFIGKDNIVFHAIFFPAMLMGYGGYVLQDNVPANEFLNLEGNKLSTSKNYAVWLDDYLKKFSPDPLRYCLASILPETKDTDFSWKDFQARNNFELADIIGNFINRTLTFAERFFENKIPSPENLTETDKKMLETSHEAFKLISEYIEKYQIRNAVKELTNVARTANKYFNDEEPWKTVKENKNRCGTTIYVCIQVVGYLAELMNPFMPFSSEKIWKILNVNLKTKSLKWGDKIGDILPPSHTLGKPEILFRKIEDSEIEPEIEKLKRISAEIETPEKENNIINFEDFEKIDLRVATILSCEKVKKSERLLKIEVDDGKGRKQIVAGISQYYEPEQLIGKKIIIVTNLKPAKLMGEESNGMLLAATSGDKLTLLTTDNEIDSGSKVS
ncbi:methionine--tRNA ligase [candidate division KSB1 bacterium]